MNDHHDMNCQEARERIPSYLDGELSETAAAPLRRHLMDCQPCRASAQSDKNLKRWFVEPKAMAVPRDFSARVARRAFAGDTGERFSPPSLVPAGAGAAPSLVAVADARTKAPASRSDERHLRFVLLLTAAAALVLLMLSLSIRSLAVPGGTELKADSRHTMTADEALQHLDQLNGPAANTTPAHGSNPASGAEGTTSGTPAKTPAAPGKKP